MIQLAYILTNAAALTSEENFSKPLIKIATEMARTSAQTIAYDFESCGNVPRIKYPKKKKLLRNLQIHCSRIYVINLLGQPIMAAFPV